MQPITQDNIEGFDVLAESFIYRKFTSNFWNFVFAIIFIYFIHIIKDLSIPNLKNNEHFQITKNVPINKINYHNSNRLKYLN